MKINKLINYAPIIFLTGLRLGGFFLVSKLSIQILGHGAFVAYSQIQQIALMALPVSTAFLQLTISKSHTKKLIYSEIALIKASIISASIFGSLLIALYFMLPGDGISYILELGGVNGGDLLWLWLSLSIIPVALSGIYYSMLVGRGKAGKLTINEITVQAVVIATSISALMFNNNIIFISSSLLAYTLLLPYFLYRIYTILNEENGVHGSGTEGISPYIFSAFAATISVPLFLFVMRALVTNSEGEAAAAELIVAHRIIGAMLIPAVIYVNNYVQPKFFISKIFDAKSLLLKSSIATAIYGVCALLIVVLILGTVIELFFGGLLKIDLIVFAILAVAEIIKTVSMIAAHFFNVAGKWKIFVGGELLFISSAVLLTILGSSSTIWISFAYLAAAGLTLIYYGLQLNSIRKMMDYS